MIGVDDQVAVIGDWVPPNPSPRTFFSSIMGDDFGSTSFSDLLGDNDHAHHALPASHSSDKHKQESMTTATAMFNNPTHQGDDRGQNHVSDQQFSDSNQKPSPRRSLAERMAARAGFNAPTLNTTTIRSSPQLRSPYLTIPPGLSPTTLLDSPVFLSNSLVQPSPTTGKFSFNPSNYRNTMFAPAVQDRDKNNRFEDVDTSSFAFKPHAELSPSHYHCGSDKENPASATSSKQPFSGIEPPVHSEQSLQLQSKEAAEEHSQNQNSYHPWVDLCRSTIERDADDNDLLSDPITAKGEGSPELDDQQDGEGDQRSNGELNSTVINASSSEDGYNWRKYGQKQVKGSECPRSYYKCTHANCQVKKKVERSHEGHITEIIYKGAHNHPKPPPSRRSAVGSSSIQNDMQLDISEYGTTQGGVEGDRVWASLHGVTAIGCPDRKHDNMEVTSSASVGLELCDPSTSLQADKVPHFEASNTVDVSSNLSNDEDDDDRGTHGSASLGCDGEGDETESKRRKIEATEMGGVARAIREPRVVVQTTSEVDILDDGYRWRKYGQKVVKGNPNPRSYYKCTNPGCTVRKHVERASHDLKSVITTYEGKHNHDVPAARSSSHVNSGASNSVAAPTAQSRTHRPEPYQVHESMPMFDGSVSLGRQQPRSLPGFSFGMGQPGLANLSMAGQSELPPLPVYLRQYLGQQQVNEAGGFVMPKGEPSEHGLRVSNGPLAYHQMMNRLPLGPQS